MSLRDYRRKRDFTKTAEPEPARGQGKGGRFVIQKHAASHLHYDFRLEMGGTLKSWAVPKGMPYARGEKRLAIQVEDHPVSYIDFEGSIPKGQYGGGTVMVWDQGTFEPLGAAPLRELAVGKLHFILHGKKLQGEWYLVRLHDQRQWLLIRAGAGLRPVSKKLEDTSALSGKSMSQLGQGGRVWESKPRAASAPSSSNDGPKPKKTAAVPAFIEPMKAQLVDAPPAGEWLYEVKFDGYRALAIKQGGETRLYSRNKKDFNAKFPEIVRALEKLAVREAVFDGEIVALDAKGRSSFQLLQALDLGEARPPVFFYVFDLLRLDGNDLRPMPLAERKQRLEKLLRHPPEGIRLSASLRGKVRELLKQAGKLGLEGLIGKRSDSVYEPGRRSGAWIKLKLRHEQEFVIGGHTDPEGSREHFGALLIGYYEGEKLKFAGKVGTGFDRKLLASLHAKFKKLQRSACPFVNLPEKAGGRGQAITAARMKRCHWVEPSLICQVEFAEWTHGGKLRQPAFLGLREDKEAKEVVREKAKGT